MTQREKLYKLLDGKILTIELEDSDKIWATEKIGELTDYLIENGVIVPPCKVGDTVWLVLTEKGNNDWDILEDIVGRFVRCDSYEFVFDMEIFGYIHIDRETNNIDDSLYDGCAYFTKEEAEKALAEKENDK